MIDLAQETRINGVRVRLTKKQREFPIKERLRLSRWVRAVAHVAAAYRRRFIRPKVSLDARRLRPKSGDASGGYLISKDYRRKMGLSKSWFRSRAEFLRAKPKPRAMFWNTGGMWGMAPPDQMGTKGGGMQVRGSGRDKAVIDFAGSSVGRSTVATGTITRGKNKGKTKYKGKVRNALKAATVYRQTGVQLTAPDDDLIEDLVLHVQETAAAEARAALGIDVKRGRTEFSFNDRDLARDLKKLRR